MSNNIETEIDEIVENEKIKLKNCTSGAAKFNICCNIIRLIGKNSKEYTRNLQYRLSKKIIIYNIRAIEENPFGYDYIDKINLNECIENFSSEEKINILIFYRRMLEKNGFTEEIDWINDEIIKNKIFLHKKNKKYFPYLLSLSARNTYGILFTILLIFIITTISLIETNIKYFQLFHFKKVIYIDISMLNHLINTLSVIFNIDTRQEFYPLSGLGVAILLSYKFLAFIFVANFIIEEIKKRMKV